MTSLSKTRGIMWCFDHTPKTTTCIYGSIQHLCFTEYHWVYYHRWLERYKLTISHKKNVLCWNVPKAFSSNHWSSKHVLTALHSNRGGPQSFNGQPQLTNSSCQGRTSLAQWAPRETHKALEKPLVAIARQSQLCYHSKEALTSTQTSGARLHKRGNCCWSRMSLWEEAAGCSHYASPSPSSLRQRTPRESQVGGV